MIAPSLGDSKENPRVSSPTALNTEATNACVLNLAISRSAELQADGSRPELPSPTIAVVGLSGDTAVAFRLAMSELWNPLPFDDGLSFLTFSRLTPVDCLITELGWPGVSALALHQEWSDRDPWATTVLLAENPWPGDLFRFFLKGAIRLLRTPWDQDALRRTIDETQREGAAKRAAVLRRRRMSEKVGRLTPIERQIVDGLYLGYPHKHIASRLGVSLRMVDYRRKCALRKLEVGTLAELVRFVAEIEFAGGDA